MRARRPIAGLLVLASACIAHAGAQDQLLDDFRNSSAWQARHTDDVSASLRPSHSPGDAPSLCLDFDFHGVSGSASLLRALPLDWPAEFELSFQVRGQMKPNTLQLKAIDASGDNVWMYQHPGFEPGSMPQRIRLRRAQLGFAWGPTRQRELSHSASLELLVYVEQGGAGHLCFDDLRLTPLPATAAAASNVATAPHLLDTPNRWFEQLAHKAPRGAYPRGFSGEQSYWTVLGLDGGGAHAALLSEDGAVEVDKGGWSVEPMLLTEHGVLDWAGARIEQSLQDGYLPIPSTQWHGDALGLRTTAFLTGTLTAPQLWLDYELSNDNAHEREITLALLARPFQVNPPTQFLNTPGGISPIHRLRWSEGTLSVDEHRRIVPLLAPSEVVASTLADGNLAERLARGERPRLNQLEDPSGYAQGALLYRLRLPPHGHRRLGLLLPGPQASPLPADPLAWMERQRALLAAEWREKLNRVELHLPRAAQAIADTARSALAQMLISRDGPALRPGTRSYARSWVRDGAMMTEGLVRSGHAEVAAQFVQWYAPHQFSNGKVPCCVDARGADPVPENDSHGELIFAIAELWRYTHDKAQLERLWPHVQRAITYMDGLRASERGAANQGAETRELYGLMPASISHEGYSAKPMHAYWDDFWALQGYADAVRLARALGHDAEANVYAAARDQFRQDLADSITATVARRQLDYLPGAAELGDFDATSTTIALSPGDGLSWLPPGLLQATFEAYWRGFLARRDGTVAWTDYTPYELRTIASFVRLGWRERVPDLLAFFFADQRPRGWNQWAEVVGHDPREPRFVGDMPHAWIASDYLRSAYDLFAYPRDHDQSMVLAAGIAPAWLAGDGVAIERLRTPYGWLSYTLRERGDRLVLNVPAGLALPPGGLVLPWPYPGRPHGTAWLDGKPVAWDGDEIRIERLPARLELARPD